MFILKIIAIIIGCILLSIIVLAVLALLLMEAISAIGFTYIIERINKDRRL